MPTRLSRTILGDRYGLSEPIIPSNSLPFRVLAEPITALTYSRFLNELRHAEHDNGPVLVNTVNYEQPLCLSDGRWRPRPGRERRPMTLLTFSAARLLAERVGMRLMELNQWEAVLALDRPYLQNLSSAVLNIEDVASGPIDVDQTRIGPSGVRGLLGNVGFWGEQALRGFAWSFGVGWNKSRLHVRGPAARHRWIHATSVSTGVRLVEYCEGSAQPTSS